MEDHSGASAVHDDEWSLRTSWTVAQTAQERNSRAWVLDSNSVSTTPVLGLSQQHNPSFQTSGIWFKGSRVGPHGQWTLAMNKTLLNLSHTWKATHCAYWQAGYHGGGYFSTQCWHVLLLPPFSGTKLPLRFDCDLLRHFSLPTIRFAFQTKLFLHVKKKWQSEQTERERQAW